MSIIKERENLMNLKRDEMNIHTGDILNLTKPIKEENYRITEWGMGRFEVTMVFIDFSYWERDTIHLLDLETGDKWCSDYESIKNGTVSVEMLLEHAEGEQLLEAFKTFRCKKDEFGFTFTSEKLLSSGWFSINSDDVSQV